MRIQGHRATSLALLACIAISWCSAASRACPADLISNGVVDVDDLLVVINAWGDSGPADITQNGVVDVDDLLTLINAWGPCPDQTVTTTIVGIVQLSDGTTVQDAVVISDLGGQGTSGAKGEFQFEVTIPLSTQALNLAGVATINTFNYVGSAQVNSIIPRGITDAGVIVLSGGTPTCDELSWLPTFGGAPGFNESVYALAVFDDSSGGGPSLYAGGYFSVAGGVSASRIAKWDGTSWSPVGGGTNYGITSLTVFDDSSGGGPALYAGGDFTIAGGVSANRIAKWDGSSWSALASGLTGGSFNIVAAMAVFDDGSGGGPALFAAGDFTTAGGATVNCIAKWNGSSWSALGTGMNSNVYALAVFDDGSGGGPALYAAGFFTLAGGVSANHVAKWNGSSWSPLGSGTFGAGGGEYGEVYALTVFDDGSGDGPALYVGGAFELAGGLPANHIAKWNGSSWSAVGDGLVGGPVNALTVFDDGSAGGPELYASGGYGIVKWNGSSWSFLSGGIGTVLAMKEFDDGSENGPALYAGGNFFIAGGVAANHIAKWNDSSWSPVGPVDTMNLSVGALIVFDDGSEGGPALYAGGGFTGSGGVNANRIAKWNGSYWSALGSGVDLPVHALAGFDDGSGPALFAGGLFTSAGGVDAKYVAKWNGSSWSALGNGPNFLVEALAVFDHGSGPALYAGGWMPGPGLTKFISKWNGTSWTNLGANTNDYVSALTVFDDGSGPALYAGGRFTIAGGVSANRIAKWNGTSWSPLGSGLNNEVRSLEVFDDGSGPALYVGGAFSIAGGVSASRIAKWNGTSWSALGGGVDGWVADMAVFDDGTGSGPALYVGGQFNFADGVAVNRIAKWDGSSWSALASGMDHHVQALAVFDDGSGGGPALHAGGAFFASPAGDSFLAKWGCPATK